MSWQIDITLWLQQFGGLSAVMKFFTFLGREEFFLLLIPLVYLCIDPRLGIRVGFLVLLGDALNCLAKLAFHAPRPYWIDTRVKALVEDTSYGLPSSHAQNALAVWSFLAFASRRKWALPAAIALIFVISLSRVYLGVHFVTDILGGWAIGLVFLLLYLKCMPAVETKLRGMGTAGLVALTAGGVALLFLVGLAITASLKAQNDPASWSAFSSEARSLAPLVSRCGAILGLGIGWALARKSARFEVAGSFAMRTARFVLAVIGLLVFWKGLQAVFPREPENLELAFRFVRYALMSWWVTFLAPWLFLRAGLLKAAKVAV